MESEDKWKETGIKNRTCYYFDDIIGVMDRESNFEFSDISLDEKLYKEKYKNILIYGISYKTPTGAKPPRIRFNNIDGFSKTHNGIWYLVLFDHWQFDKIRDRIENLISEKSGTADSINHNFGKIRIDSYNSLPIEKI